MTIFPSVPPAMCESYLYVSLFGRIKDGFMKYSDVSSILCFYTVAAAEAWRGFDIEEHCFNIIYFHTFLFKIKK